jgi:hypothetical protein
MESDAFDHLDAPVERVTGADVGESHVVTSSRDWSGRIYGEMGSEVGERGTARRAGEGVTTSAPLSFFCPLPLSRTPAIPSHPTDHAPRPSHLSSSLPLGTPYAKNLEDLAFPDAALVVKVAKRALYRS